MAYCFFVKLFFIYFSKTSSNTLLVVLRQHIFFYTIIRPPAIIFRFTFVQKSDHPTRIGIGGCAECAFKTETSTDCFSSTTLNIVDKLWNQFFFFSNQCNPLKITLFTWCLVIKLYTASTVVSLDFQKLVVSQ